jgi:hypothetical protein
LNPVRASDPFGANSVCQGYGYERPGWTLADPSARTGTLDEIRIASRALDDERTLGLCAREISPDEALSLLIIARRIRLPALREPAGRARQPDPSARDSAVARRADAVTGSKLVEYAAHEAHAEFVAPRNPR